MQPEMDDFLSQVVQGVLQTASMQYKEDWTKDPEKIQMIIDAFQQYLDNLGGKQEPEENNNTITPEKIAEAKAIVERTSYRSKGPYQTAVNLLIDAHLQGLLK